MKQSEITVTLTFTEQLLATASGNKDLAQEFVISRSGDADKQQEELATLPKEEAVEKSSTVFHRDAQGLFIWDYQVKGYFKEVIGHMCELGEFSKLSKWTHKRAVDGTIFVKPRRIYLMRDGVHLTKPDGTLQRPLRVVTQQGERVALARSEFVGPGTTIEFSVLVLESANSKSSWIEITMDLVRQCLDLGTLKGTGQWRSGGYGRFDWAEKKNGTGAVK